MDFDASLVENDVAQLLRLGSPKFMQQRPLLQASRVKAIQESARLQAWLSVDRSTILQVNSNTDTRYDQSGSFVTAKLFRVLEEQARRPPSPELEVVPLAFFCGNHHNSYVDAAATASAMAESLLLQLVDRHRAGFESADLRACWEQVRREDDVESTMHAFGRLIDRMETRAMVFVLVDRVEAFQTPPQRRQETGEILQQLVALFRRREREWDGTGPKMKLLVSTSTACHLIQGLLREEEVVTIPKTPRPGGPSDKTMNMTLL